MRNASEDNPAKVPVNWWQKISRGSGVGERWPGIMKIFVVRACSDSYSYNKGSIIMLNINVTEIPPTISQ